MQEQQANLQSAQRLARRDELSGVKNKKAYANSLKKSKNEKTREMGNLVDHSFDMSDRKFIEPVVEYVMGAMAKEA